MVGSAPQQDLTAKSLTFRPLVVAGCFQAVKPANLELAAVAVEVVIGFVAVVVVVVVKIEKTREEADLVCWRMASSSE